MSIIVPVYNVEKFLDECVNSLLSQEYTNLEIILVDDGSKDNSGEKCDYFARLDKRIKVYHKINGGLSDARNYGLDVATGDFIVFVDSDDFVSKQYVKRLKQCQEESNADIVVCGYLPFLDGHNPLNEVVLNGNSSYEEYSSDDALNNLYDENRVKTVLAWNKLYRKSCFNTIRYPVGKLREDEFTTYKLITQCSRIAYLGDALYFYRTRVGSIMQSTNPKVHIDYVLALIERREYFKKNNMNKQLMDKDANFVLSELFVILLENRKSFSNEEYQIIYSFFIKIFNERKILNGLSYKIIAYRYFPKIYALHSCLKRKAGKIHL